MTSYLQQRAIFPPQIWAKPSLNLGIIVVIPAKDEPYLLLSLMALHRCTRPTCDVEVIIVINGADKDSEDVKERNLALLNQVRNWAKKNRRYGFKFYAIHHPDLTPKYAGVGLARKIGMDEATWRFQKIKNPKGIIACFDADCRCDENYLVSLEAHFKAKPKAQACSIYFEHPLSGANFEDEIYQSIISYELHLRYYIQAQRFAAFPMAYHTVGSSMAVRCTAYQKQGGMNRRKAGEDFYFIHKFTGLGQFQELNTTRVIPSPRPSTRVPFGTGRAILGIIKDKGNYQTYALQSFEDLRLLFSVVLSLYKEASLATLDLPDSVRAFLKTQSFEERLVEIRKHTASSRSFRKRFFQWFDAFMLMKYVHFTRDHFYPNVNVMDAAKALLHKLGIEPADNEKALLLQFRKLDRGV